jgi:flagellar biosynthesis GTPase FlhF
MEGNEKVIQTIRMNGPVIPAQIAKVLNKDIMMTSAMLSELVSKKILKISNVKVGSSPLYYLPGQESKLQNFSNNLHEKEKGAYDILIKNKVLRDKELEPVARVALRNIKDFAVPLRVKLKDNEEIFWKWYLTTNQEAENIIKDMIKQDENEEKHDNEEKKVEKEPETEEQEKKQEPVKEKEEKSVEEKERKEKEEVKENKQTEEQDKKENFYHEKKEEDKSKFIDKTAQDPFLKEIKKFLEKNNIELIESKILKKNSEVELILELPSSVGTLNYYCMAKNKKRITDSDLSSAFVQGQLKKLPVLVIIKGELTKKAKEMLSKEFKGMKIKKI